MSGVNAAATLTLEVNTGSADEKLNALEQRLNKLDGTHEVKISLSNVGRDVDSSIGKIKTLETEVAVLNAKLAGSASTLSASYGQSFTGFSYKLKQGLGDAAESVKKQLEGIASATRGLANQQVSWSFKIDRNFAGQVTAEARKAFEASVQYDKAWVEAHALNLAKISEMNAAAAKVARQTVNSRAWTPEELASDSIAKNLAKQRAETKLLLEAHYAGVSKDASTIAAVAAASRKASAASAVNSRAWTPEELASDSIAKNLAKQRAETKLLLEAHYAAINSDAAKLAESNRRKGDASQKIYGNFLHAGPSGQQSIVDKVSAASLLDADTATARYGRGIVGLIPQLEQLRLANTNVASSHKTAASAAVAHEEKIRGLPKHMWEAHSAARGLAGGLNALWLTYGATVPLMAGAALSGGFVAAAKAGSEFAYQLTFVKALGGETAESIAGIGKAALSLSKTSMYGPVELANGLRILSQAGLSATDSLLALPQAMSLATVGEMNMEQAAITLTGVMNAFNLGVGDMAHIGDVFAKAAALSQTSVQGMTEAMKTASVVGEQYGASMEDTATALTLLAKVNISGTAAGTALRNMLKELYAPTAGAAKVIKQLGIETKDAQGNMKSFPEIIYQLKGILAGYDKASQVNILQALFGERGAKEAIAMLGKTREEWDKLNQSISESDGFMRRVGAQLESTASAMFKQAFNTMQANLIGAFEKSEGAAKDLAVALRNLADSAQFKEAINGIVESVSKLATVLVEATPTLIRFGEAWLVWKGIGLLVGGINMATGAIRGLGVTMAIVSAEAALAGGGLAGLRAGLLAAGSAAGVAAGATGVGMLSRVLSVMTSPITAVVVGLGGLAYAINEYVLKMPAAVDAANTFVDSLDRESRKLREEIELLEKKNRLQLSGKAVDTSAAERELTDIVKNRDNAIDRKNDETLSYRERFMAEREYSAFVEAEAKARGKLRDLENNQIRYDAANLTSVIQTGRERLKDIQADADAAKKKVDTSAVETLLNAYEGKKLSGSDIRAVQKELDRRLNATGQSLLGSGDGKWEPQGRGDRSTQKDERAKFNDNLSSNLNREKLRTDAALLEIEQKLAEQSISSVEAAHAKQEANRNLLQTQKEVLEAALAEAVQREDSTLVLKTWNDLQEKEAEIAKQAAAAKLELTKMRVAEKNAIEDISRSSARYSEDLQNEIEYLGKTTLEVQQLRIEKQRLRAVQDIQQNLDRGSISPDVANAQKDEANAKAKLDDAEAARQLSFVGGWQKAYDENLKNITDMSKAAGDIFNKMSDSMADSLTEFVMTGKMSFGDLVSSMIKDMVRMQMKALSANMLGLLGNAFGFGSSSPKGPDSLGPSVNKTFAMGGVMQSPGLHAYANQIHDTPKFFAFAHGAGVFGEAGPEAIMPLKRGPDGKLGVQAASSSGFSLVINNNGTPHTVTGQREEIDSRGRRSMILDLADAMGGEAQRSGSRFNRSLSAPRMISR
jgi:TP901 family phage tail tape measure protein/lambda family phage tail tape measure protein